MSTQILEQLLPFLPEVDCSHLRIEQLENDDQCYEISDEVRGIPLAFLRLNEDEEFDSYFLETDYYSSEEVKPKEVILKKTNEFVDTFLKKNRESLHLSAVVDLDDDWWIEFIRKDPYLGLELPNSGVTIRVEKNGLISSVDMFNETYRLEEPVIRLSAEEAKHLFLEQLVLTPTIAKYDTDYLGGNNEYHLVYGIEDFVMDVGTDGELHTIEMFGVKRLEYEKLISYKSTSDKLDKIIGIPEKFMKYVDKMNGNRRLEVWGEQLGLENEYEFEEIEFIAGTVEMSFDEHDHIIELSYMSEEEDNLPIATYEEALKRAVVFLQLQYKNALNNFRLVKEENRLFEYDEDGEQENVYAYQFTFQRFEREVIVSDATISVEVDGQNTKINSVSTNLAVTTDLSTIDLVCIFPIEKAKEVYGNALQMDRAWSREFEEDPVTYTLNYLPAFPETVGHMRAIDAKNGKPWIIDTSCMEEF